MAFAAVNSTTEPRSFSVGTQKVQIMTWSAASGDTSGTITADRLYRLDHILMDGGLIFTAAPTMSGNTATIAFADPLITCFGSMTCVGK